MNREQIHAINRERVGCWVDTLTQCHATALVLVGVGHDHNSGQLHLCRTEDGLTNADLARLLRWAGAQLDKRELS